MHQEAGDVDASSEDRIGGVTVPAPNGTLALLGGQNSAGDPVLTVEMFFPQQ